MKLWQKLAKKENSPFKAKPKNTKPLMQEGGKVVTKDRKDKEGIAAERAKGNTVYMPKPKSPKSSVMKKGGTVKCKK